jgi:hypothetical protein
MSIYGNNNTPYYTMSSCKTSKLQQSPSVLQLSPVLCTIMHKPCTPILITFHFIKKNEYNFGQNMLVSYKVLDLHSFIEVSFSLITTHRAVLLYSYKCLLVQISHIIINNFDMVSLLCSKHDGNFFNTQDAISFF